MKKLGIVWLEACLLSALLGLSGCITPVEGGEDASFDEPDSATPEATDDASTPIRADAAEPGRDASVVPPLHITSADRIRGTLDQPIELALTAAGGAPPYAWTLSPVSLLPVGFTFSSDGVLRGTPHATGHFPFGVSVSDTSGRIASATVEVYVAEAVANDVCIAATPLDLSTGATTVLATLEGAVADGVAQACQLDASFADVFYSFSLPAASKVLVSSTASVSLIRDGCGPWADPLVCDHGFEQLLPPGDYLVAVTGPAAGFRLDVKVTPQLGDSCQDIIPLDLSSGQATVTGNFAGAKSDFTLTCGYSSSGADRVFSFELAADADVRVRDQSYGNVKTIRTGDCPGKVSLGCSEGSGDLFLLNLKAGKYVLIVKNYYGSENTFSLTVTTSGPTLPPNNDTCTGATPLTLVNNKVSFSGSLLGATYDTVPSTCGSTNADVYYSLNLASPSTLAVSSSSTASVEVLSGSCTSLASEGCGDYSYGGLCLDDLPAGPYLLRVGSPYSSSMGGSFAYTLTRSDPLPAPANDTCAAPSDLTFKSGTATASGQLAKAAKDFTLSCSGSTGLHDVVHAFTLTERSDLSIAVKSTDYSHFLVGVLSDDCEAGTEVACGYDTDYQPLKRWGLEPGRYWVVVAGYSSYGTSSCWAGNYSLSVTATASPPQPANDSCAAPTAYTFAGPGSATIISGSTVGATDDFGKVSCSSYSSAGADVVYAITLSASARLRITATTPPSGLFFYLTASCGSTSTLNCSGTSYSSPYEILTNPLPAGTYYLVVDSLSSYGSATPFDFSLVLDTL
ncbi:MAG: hypothetical protein QM765_23045 [Myxococcales bacterium]